MLSIDDLTLTGDDKIKADLHGKNWRIYEEEKQKEQGEESSRELAEMSLRHYHQQQQQQYEDDFFNEYCKNGEYIDWQRWTNKPYVTPFEAARLTYLVEPIKWKEDKNYFGSFSKEELVEFEHLQTDLERKQDCWTFAQLITELKKIGIEPPLRMVEAVNNQESFNSDGAIEAKKKKPVNNQTKPTKKPINEQRDDDFTQWINESKPDLEQLTKKQVQQELIKRNRQLWCSGFDDWIKYTKLYNGKAGRPKTA